MAKFSMLYNNGYRLDFDCQIEASSAKEARKLWLKREAGSYKERSVRANPRDLRASRVQEACA